MAVAPVTAHSWPVLAPTSPAGVTPGRPPTLSVVIPAYRAAHRIGAALDSVAAQTLLPLEVVVCDDGSEDDLAAAVTGRGPQVRLVRHDRNRGAGAARNTAVRAAVGEVVVLLDDDDTWDVRRLEALSDVLAARPDLDIVTTDAWLVVDGEQTCRADELQPFECENQAAAILVRNFIFGHAAVRRNIWLRAGGFAEDLAVGEDWVGWQQMLRSGSRAGMVDLPLAHYRRRPDSATADRGRFLRDRLTLLERSLLRSDLLLAEREEVQGLCRQERLKTAWHAIDARAADRRTLCWHVVADRGAASRARAAALLGALAPTAHRRVRRRVAGPT